MPGFYNAVIYARYPDIHLYQNITRVQFHPGEYPHKIRPGKGGRWGLLIPYSRFFCTRVRHPAGAYLIDIPNVVFFLNPAHGGGGGGGHNAYVSLRTLYKVLQG